MAKQSSLSKTIQWWGIIFLLVVGGSIIALDTTFSYRDFQARAAQFRTNYIDRQKEEVKQEVELVVTMINYEQLLAEQATRDQIQVRVEEAYAVAENIYRQNQTTKNDTDIQQMIVDALRPIHHTRGRGYYFITRMDGIKILFADKPEIEGRNLLDMQDTHGQYVIKDIIAIATRSGEGFYEYHWTKPGAEGNDFKKISFVKLFEPYGWIIGTGLYVDDVDKQIKNNLLSLISRVRFGQEGYIFVDCFNGDALVSNGKLLDEPKKLWQSFNGDPEEVKAIFAKEYDTALLPEGDYINYGWQKLTTADHKSAKTSFICGIPELQWIVGAGFYHDDVEADIAMMRTKLNSQIRRKITFSSLVFAGILTLFLFFFSRLNHQLKNDFNLFLSFFNRATHFDEKIDLNQVHFAELDQMAKNANQMLQDKDLAQQELQQSEIKYRDLIENSPDIHYQTDMEDNIVYISRSVQRLSGYTVEELVGRKMADCYATPGERDAFLTVLKKDGYINDFITQLQCKDGSFCWTSSNAQFYKDNNGNILGVDGISRDVTQRIQTERLLRDREAKLESILQAASTGIGVMVNRVFQEVNQRFCDMVGYSEPELLGKDSRMVYPSDEEHARVGREQMAFIHEPSVITVETLLRHKSGSIINTLVSWSLLHADNIEAGIVFNVLDISEQKQLEEQLFQTQKMESIGNLAGGVAHDFNNILTVINMHSEVAMMELDEGSELFQDIEEIHKASIRAANLTRQLLTFSRKQTIAPRTVDINSLFTDMGKMLSRLISEDIHLETSLDIHVGSIYADPGQLEQIIMNLVVNARDAIQAEPEGGEKLIQISTSEVLLDQDHVVAHPASTPGWYVQLQVADSGCGMSEEVREHIFEPFYTTKGVGEGTGMGLATVYGIVKQNNGLIDVSSELRRGTTFKVYWPRQADEVAAQVVEVEAEKVRGGSETILLVEDEPQLREVICRQLQKAGYTVIKAENGQLALELATNYSGMIDLLFTDVVMPLMGGKELSDKIKVLYPRIPAIPVLRLVA